MMKRKDCVFCHFQDKEVIIHEDELCYVIISKDPINQYHILVIPREHYEDFIDLPGELASHIFLVAKKLSFALRKTCHPDAIHHLSDDDISKKGYNLAPQYKFHLIPRFKNDRTEIKWHRDVGLDIKMRAKFTAEIKKYLIF